MKTVTPEKLNPAVVQELCSNLGQVVNELTLKNTSQFIYNLDEKSCRLTIDHTPHVSRKGRTHVHVENVIVVEYINPLG